MMSEEISSLELQYETINNPDKQSFEYGYDVSSARQEVASILSAEALSSTAVQTEAESVPEQVQAAAPEVEAIPEKLTPLQIGINIEAVRRAELADVA